MMRRRTSHSVGALLLLLVARGAPSAGSPASGTLARPRLEGSASGRPREPQAAFGRRQATSGAQLLKLLAGDGVAYSQFGISVAVSSDGARVVVGAGGYYDDDELGSQFGSAYVLDGATGERLLKLVASDGAQLDRFGYSVAVSSDGARVVVGSFYDSDQGTAFGSAYVFNGTTGERLLKLVASDGAANDYFGDSVAVSSDGARVVVGAMNDDDQGTNSGSAYVFDFTEATTETTTATTTKTATTTTDTGTSSAASSTTTIIKTNTETTTETTTATTTKTATTTTDTGMSSDTSNTTATTEPWGLIAVFAGVLILFLVCCVALGCLVKRRRGRSPRPERGIDNAEVKDNEYNESEQVAEI
ncbi:unnamed protein product [Prorocentrum cordatum]|uniref:Uncharacterized protein n=1 Tax=Prorocentrum cordatum TaxID=2364126 RepID=A0ABN9RK93_9DINO|nr:unnamed protein product [Polarella glacialis]